MFSKATIEDPAVMNDEDLFAESFNTPSLFGVIVDRYQKAFLRAAGRIVKDPDLSEDVVQDAFVKIYRRGKSFTSQGRGSFKSWAYKVLINTALTHYQGIKKKQGVSFTPEILETTADLAEEGSRIQKEDRDYITSVLDKMPANLSGILGKFFLQGKSQEEIAREEGLTVGAVKVRIYRAKESFRQIAAEIKI